jgi:hypothetical protein
MGNIIKEMLYHMPEGLMRNNILLSAMLAIPALYNSATVQAVLFFALRDM